MGFPGTPEVRSDDRRRNALEALEATTSRKTKATLRLLEVGRLSDPAQSEGSLRTQRARLGALVLHSKHNSKELSQPARDAFMARFEREVDPDGVLDPAERARRSVFARKAYFARLALKSAKARRKAASS